MGAWSVERGSFRRSRGDVIAEWSVPRDFGFDSRHLIVEQTRGFCTD